LLPLSKETEVQQIIEAGKDRLDALATKDDLKAFALRYFPHYFRDADGKTVDFGWPQLEFIKAIQDGSNKASRLCWAMPRGYAKTTILQIACVWWIVFNRKKFILVVGESREKAGLFMSVLKEELEANEKLRKDFGNLDGTSTWGKQTFVTQNGVRVQARGPKTSVRGLKYKAHRPDCAIVDDLEEEKTVATIENRNALHEWFRKALMSVISEKGDIFMVGTKLHHDAVLCRILEN